MGGICSTNLKEVVPESLYIHQKPAQDNGDRLESEEEKRQVEKNDKPTSPEMKIMRQVQLFRALNPTEFETMFNFTVEAEYQDGQVIVEENQPACSFFIMKEGKADVFKEGRVMRSICKHDYFGERAILDYSTRSATVVSVGKSTCWVIDKDNFLGLLDSGLVSKLKRRIMLQDDSIQLEDLYSVMPLGSGMFGQVILAVHKTKQTIYALKGVSRAKINRYDLFSWLQLEREILLQLDHEFIMKLVRTFKDSEYLYFLTEYVEGVDFFQVLRQKGTFKERDAQFYATCLLMVLIHLNERGIVYRDLKPENVMVDREGYPKLIDFGTAKQLDGRTFTVVGTPQYMAPEVILGNGYSFSADYWALGVMIYEMLCGRLPFGTTLNDPYEVYEEVLRAELKFPIFVQHKKDLIELLTKMLTLDPAGRFSSSQLFAHSWFQYHNFESLLCRDVTTPFRPRLKTLDEDIQRAISRAKQVRTAFQAKAESQDLQFEPRPEPNAWDDKF